MVACWLLCRRCALLRCSEVTIGISSFFFGVGRPRKFGYPQVTRFPVAKFAALCHLNHLKVQLSSLRSSAIGYFTTERASLRQTESNELLSHVSPLHCTCCLNFTHIFRLVAVWRILNIILSFAMTVALSLSCGLRLFSIFQFHLPALAYLSYWF